DRRRSSPARVLGRAADRDPLAIELTNRRRKVVAHQRELMLHAALERRPFARMHTELSRRQGQDEPASAVVDITPAEDITEHGSYRFGLRRVHDGVHSGYCHRILRSVLQIEYGIR